MSGPVAATMDANGPLQDHQMQGGKSQPRRNETLLMTVKEGVASQGQPLDAATRAYFESKLSHDFGSIRVHDNGEAAESARRIDADAYSVGNDVVFAPGRFRPGTARGNRLIAHELVHTVQQQRNTPSGSREPDGMELSNQSDTIESEASLVAERVTSMAGNVPTITSAFPTGRTVIIARQQTTLQEVGPEGPATDPVEGISNAIMADMQGDPDDNSGNVRRRLESLRPPAKQNVIERLQSRLAPEQKTRLLAVLSRPAPKARTPEMQKMSSKTPQEMAASVGDRSFIQREVSREATGPKVTAKFTDNGPVILMPASEPEPPQQVVKRLARQQETVPKKQTRPAAIPKERTMLEEEPPAGRARAPEEPEVADMSSLLEAPEQVGITEPAQPIRREGPAVSEIAGRLNEAAEQDKGQVMEEAAALKASIAGNAESEVAKTREMASRQVVQVRAYFSQRRSNITSHVEQQRAAIRSQALQDATQLESESMTRANDFQTQMSQKRTDITSYVEEQKGQPQSMVDEEISRSNTELETAAGESEQTAENEASRHPGSEDPAPDQRAAARGVGRDSARDIREKKPAIAQDLRSRLDGFSGEYGQYADTVNSRITETENIVVPAFGEISTTSAGLLAQGEAATLESIESRSSADLQTLSLLETTAVNSLMAKSRITIGQIKETSRIAHGHLDEAAAAILSEIDAIVAEGGSIVQEPSLLHEAGVPSEEAAGVIDPVEEYIMAERNLASQSRSQLAEAVATVNDNMPMINTSFAAESVEAAKASRAGADNLRQKNAPAIDKLVQARSQQGQSVVAHTRSQQEELATSATSEVNSAAEQARSEVSGINEKFRGELHNGANESIREARKPRTDRVEDREAEAAERAGKSWIVGVFRAIGDIVVGLLILALVALVVAAFALAFGVVLGLWGALMIAGGIMLAVGLIMSIVNRSQQKEFREAGLGTQILVVAGDTLGLTNLVEGITGREVLTGTKLSESEQARRATIGAFSAVMLLLGARSALRGGPRAPVGRPAAAPGKVIPIRGRAPAAPGKVIPIRGRAPAAPGKVIPIRGRAPAGPSVVRPPPRPSGQAVFEGSLARTLPAEPLPVIEPLPPTPPAPAPAPIQVPAPYPRVAPLIIGAAAAAAPNLAHPLIEEITAPEPTPVPVPVPLPQPEPEPEPECPCPTGLTSADPIQIDWYKVREDDYYPRAIVIQGITYDRDDPTNPRRLPHGEPIGISEAFWPRPGKIFQLIPSERGPNAGRFRAVLEGYGYNWSGLQADHVQDLQWEGPDEFENLWPLSSSANLSAGPRQNNLQPVCYCETPTGPHHPSIPLMELKRPGGWGRYFMIRRVIR
jgi:Domain of unknown function (DUF4157)